MRLIVTGTRGRVARSLLERALVSGVESRAVGRPDLDLADPQYIEQALTRWRADVVVNAAAVIAVAKQITTSPNREGLTGVFHMTGGGEATWAEFAEAIFSEAATLGGEPVAIKPITTADYPTRARRPANSRLDGGRLAEVYGVELPPWRASVKSCVSRLMAGATA
jgi:dTDP-4-dehydrorhamnose reductase